MRQLLIEGYQGALPFIVDRSKAFVRESRNGLQVTRIPGRFSICDSVNGNNRRYPKKVWEKNLQDGSPLKNAISQNSAFGLLEHPANGQISLLSPICIMIVDAKLQPGTDKESKPVMEVVGEIAVLSTPEGQKLQTLIDAGYNPKVSSRGFGSVVKCQDGIDDVQDDYICEGWDVILKPSFETAELQPQRENVAPKVSAPSAPVVAMTENTPPAPALPAAPAPILPSAPPQTPAAPTSETRQTTVPTTPSTLMNINEIRTRVASFKGSKTPSDLNVFAEGIQEMQQLHQRVADYVAEDAKRSWEGQRLHNEISALERTWTESASAPSKQNNRITESYRKILKVTKVLGEAAVNVRKKLTEALKQNSVATQLIEELTERGQAWHRIAEKRKTDLAEAEHKLDVACEALDIMAAQYNTDMTTVGKRLLTVEFAEKAQAPDILKLLKEAKKPKDIVAIREKLDPNAKKTEGQDDPPAETPPGDAAPAGDETPAPASAPAAPTSEGKKNSASSAGSAAPINEARVLVPSVHSVTESVQMAQRLSAANNK